MSRVSHLGIGIVLGFISFLCGAMAFMVYVSTAAAPGSSAIGGVVFFGVIVIASGYGALWSFARAFKPPRKKPNSPKPPPPAAQSHELARGATADERLAPLLKKKEGPEA